MNNFRLKISIIIFLCVILAKGMYEEQTENALLRFLDEFKKNETNINVNTLLQKEGQINDDFNLQNNQTHLKLNAIKNNKIKPNPNVIDKFITLHDIQGQWTNSDHDNIIVKDTEVFFDGNYRQVYKIEETYDRFTLNGWILKKSSKTFTWKTKSKMEDPWYRSQIYEPKVGDIVIANRKLYSHIGLEISEGTVMIVMQINAIYGFILVDDAQNIWMQRWIHPANLANIRCVMTKPDEYITNVMAKQDKYKNQTSNFTGVCWNNRARKWQSQFRHNKKQCYVGCFDNEEHAAMKINLLCDKLEIERKNPTINIKPNEIQQKNQTSNFIGVHWNNRARKWQSQLMYNKKKHNCGYFDIEEHAAMTINLLCDKLEIEHKNPTININPNEIQQKNFTSKFFGVCRGSDSKKWKVQFAHNKKQYYGGCFDNEEDAAMRVNLLCDKYEIERKNPTININSNEIQQISYDESKNEKKRKRKEDLIMIKNYFNKLLK